MSEPSTPSPLTLGLELNFLHRVYRTSAVLAVLAAVFLWEGLGAPAVWGFVSGVCLSLGSLAGLEWMVRRFTAPGSQSAGKLFAAITGQMLAAAGVVVLAFFAALRGWLSLPFMALGFALPHTVLVLKLVGIKIRETMSGGQVGRGV